MKAYERKRDALKAKYLELYARIKPSVTQANTADLYDFVKVSAELHDLDLQYVRRMEQALLRNNVEVDTKKRRVARPRRIRANTNSGGD